MIVKRRMRADQLPAFGKLLSVDGYKLPAVQQPITGVEASQGWKYGLNTRRVAMVEIAIEGGPRHNLYGDSLVEWEGELTPVRCSPEASGDCVTGCGREARPYTAKGFESGYVDACPECAPECLKDAIEAGTLTMKRKG